MPRSAPDFRRTFATELLRSHDVALVGKLLNHKKTASTMTYDMVNEEEQRDAVGRIDLPGLADLTRKPRPSDPSGGPSGTAAA